MTFESIFELALKLRNKGKLIDSINEFSKILENFSTDKRTRAVYSVLGGIYNDLRENDKAFEHFKKATELNQKSELASIGLYVTLANLDRDEEAIHELIRYLKSYPANLYKVTLEELLEGLENDYMTNYEEEIRNFSKINGVEI